MAGPVSHVRHYPTRRGIPRSTVIPTDTVSPPTRAQAGSRLAGYTHRPPAGNVVASTARVVVAALRAPRAADGAEHGVSPFPALPTDGMPCV
jgi:hypothetical protein